MRRLSVCLVAVALLAAACGRGDGNGGGGQARPTFPADSSMAQIQQAGKLRVGVKYDVPQFGLLNPSTNQPEGFDVDFGKEIAKALGVQPEFSEAVSRNRIPFLQEDKVDLVFSTMTITDERKQQIDFTDVYYVAGQTFLVKKGKEITVETAGGKRVCTAKGSTSEQNLPKLQPQVQMVLQDGYAQCVQLLQNDQVDAVSTDDVILLGFVKQDPNLTLSGGRFSREPYGGGVKKGRTDLLEFANGVIQEMKEDGRWTELYEKWVTPITGEVAKPPPAEVTFEIGQQR